MGEHEYRHFAPGGDRPARIFATLGLAVLGFALGAWAINSLVTHSLWRPYLGVQTKKLARMEALAANIDVMFVGMSHFDNGIDPHAFDAELARCGHKSFSFNAAVGDLRGPELNHYLVQARATGVRPKYVFVEPLLNPTPPDSRLFTSRVRYHFSLAAVRDGLLARVSSDLPWSRKAGSIGLQLAAAAIHHSNLGVLSDVLLPPCPACEDAKLEAGPVEERPSRVLDRGFAGEVADPLQLSSASYESWLREHGGRRQLDLDGLQAPPRRLNSYEVQYLGKVFGLIRALGAEPIALFPPLSVGLHDHRSVLQGIKEHFPEIKTMSYLYAGGPLSPLFEDSKAWFDHTHMTPRGAEIFSRELAADFCRLTPNSTTSSAEHAVH